jgi:hypothetical protein
LRKNHVHHSSYPGSTRSSTQYASSVHARARSFIRRAFYPSNARNSRSNDARNSGGITLDA